MTSRSSKYKLGANVYTEIQQTLEISPSRNNTLNITFMLQLFDCRRIDDRCIEYRKFSFSHTVLPRTKGTTHQGF